MLLTIATTVLEADERLLRSIRSIKQTREQEHIISVAGDFRRARALLRTGGPGVRRLIEAPGASISEGFNECIRHSEGDLIWVLNSGDEEMDVEPLLRLLEQLPEIDFAVGAISYGGEVVRPKRNPGNRLSCLLHGMGFCHGAAVVRRAFHNRYGLYDPTYRICMDQDLFIRALWNGARVVTSSSCVARIEPAGNSGNPATRIQDLQRIMARYVPFPFPQLLAAKWRLANHVAEWLGGRH